MTVTRTYDSHTMTLPDSVADAAETLATLRPGGIATIHRYRTAEGKKVITPSVSTMTIVTRFSYGKRNDRILAMLGNLEAKSVDLVGVDASLFDEARSAMYESARKTAEGDRSDAHRQAHDTFYATIGTGVKVKMETADGPEGRKVLVVDSETGLPRFDGLHINALVLKRVVHEKGQKEPTNSKPLTLVKQRIQRVIDEAFGTFINLKLGADNFESLSIGGDVVVPEWVHED